MERKVRRNIFILIGLTVLLLVGMVLGWFFVLVSPQSKERAALQTQFDTREKAAKLMGENLKAQKKAEDRQKYLEGQLVFFQNRYRNFKFLKLGKAEDETTALQKAPRLALWRGLLDEHFSQYGGALQSAVLHAADATQDKSGVNPKKLFVSFAQPKVDPPPKAPEDIVIPTNGFVRPLSASGGGVMNVTLKGSYNQIKDFFARINLEPILFVVGTLKLDGVSPNITATFTLTPYLVAQGEGVTLASSGGTAAGTAGTAVTGAIGGITGAPPGGGAPPGNGAPPTTPPTATP